jgi:hypothetical protein
MWKNIVQPDRPQMAIWRKLVTCWIPKATKIHSEYVIFIAFPRQQWLGERATMLNLRTWPTCGVISFGGKIVVAAALWVEDRNWINGFCLLSVQNG